MKSTYITTLFALLMLLPTSTTNAQDYKDAVKVKGFSPMGIAYKHLTGFEKGYELVYQKFSHAHNVTALRVWQAPAFPKLSDKWFVCYGYGAHATLYSQTNIYNPFRPFDPPIEYRRAFASTGIDGYIGLEYRILKHPFVLSADYIPNFEFFGPDYFRVNLGATTLGVSYVF